MRTDFFNLLFLAAPLVFSSCTGERRIASVKESLYSIREEQKLEKEKLIALSAESYKKMQTGGIDSVAGKKIRSKLSYFEISTELYERKSDSLEILLKDKKKFRQQYRTWVLPALELLKKNNVEYKERLSLYLIIEDGLNIANYRLYNMAGFFAPGKYEISDAEADSVSAPFEPLIDSLILFANKYGNRKKTASLVVLGFADATGFNEKMLMKDTLLSKMYNEGATREQLNKKLSELRAGELSRLLAKLYLKKSASVQNPDHLKVEFNYWGKGEVYPLQHIKDYMENDRRRRIVLCYWIVLPD